MRIFSPRVVLRNPEKVMARKTGRNKEAKTNGMPE